MPSALTIDSMMLDMTGKVGNIAVEINKTKGRLDLLYEISAKLDDEILQLNERKLLVSQCIEVIDKIQKTINGLVKDNFESIVNSALMSVFGSRYKFELEFTRRGDIPELNFLIQSQEYSGGSDPLDNEAGGVIDIIAFILRIAIIELIKPSPLGPIVLDEAFKHLSRQHLQAIGNFLVELSSKIGRQIIFVSHSEEFKLNCANLIEVKL